MNANQIELLSPAGSVAALKAVIEAGADAVYIGGTRFGARAYAENPGEEELVAAIDYAHRRGVRVYLTVNTLLKENEIGQLAEYIMPYYIHGIDAVLVQDFGVLKLLHETFPDLPLHASTQMTITGPCGARLLGEYGVTRIVPARELSLGELRRIREESGLEVEAFVHGAMCVCYSGQCLMSSMIGGRSGNRGRCAQPCRLSYGLLSGNGADERCSGELLSPKDMCTLDYLPDMVEAGVCSFKIEGRMKQPEYAAGVTAIYRKYLDLYMDKGRENYRVRKEDKDALLTLFNRDGFSDGYLMRHNGPDMIAVNRKKLDKKEEAERSRLYEQLKGKYVDKESALQLVGQASVRTGSPLTLKITERRTGHTIRTFGEKVQTAMTRPLSEDRIYEQLMKTGGAGYLFAGLDVETDGTSFVPMAQLNALRREAFSKMDSALLEPYMRSLRRPGAYANADEDQGGRFNPFEVSAHAASGLTPKPLTGKSEERISQMAPGGRIAISASVETEEQFYAILPEKAVDRIYIPYHFISRRRTGKDNVIRKAKTYLDKASACGKKLYLSMPYVERRDGLCDIGTFCPDLVNIGFSGFLVRSFETLARLREEGLNEYVQLDSSIYTYNSEARKFLADFGVAHDTVPVELNKKELRGRDNRGSEMIVYGRLPLMITAQCMMKAAGGPCHKYPQFYLKDRKGRKFPVRCDCTFCYNIIRNPVCLSLLDEGDFMRLNGIERARLVFTDESADNVTDVIKTAALSILENGSGEIAGEHTKGHFNRGVE